MCIPKRTVIENFHVNIKHGILYITIEILTDKSHV